MQKAGYGKYYLALAAALLTFIVYLPALRLEFVNGDDGRYIFENLHVRSLGPDPDAYFQRGLLFDKMGRLDRALADFDKTISLNPSYNQAY